MPSFESQLEDLLEKEPSALVQTQEAKFRRLTAESGERFVLFGAGWLGRIALTGLRKANIEPLAFADNNPLLWGTRVEGVQVISPQSAAKEFGENALFIITVYTSTPVWEQLTAMGLKVASFAALAWQFPRTLTPHGGVAHPYKIFEQAEEVRKVLSLWADDASRREYLGQLYWQASLDPSFLPLHLPQDEIYFAGDLYAPRVDEVFVDCGAFNGDSVQEFVSRSAGSFNQIIAIEPDPVNCEALTARLASLPAELRQRIEVVQSAVGLRRGTNAFNATGTAGASVGKGTYQVECIALDELLENRGTTFIKMDIEGSEPDALMGGRSIIAKDMPFLAICLYHTQEHLWQIPSLINSINGDYNLFLRRYSDECWELVCYAVPRGRLGV